LLPLLALQLALIPTLTLAQVQVKTINGEISGPSQGWSDKVQSLARRILPFSGYFQDEELRPSLPGEEDTPTPTSVELYLRDLQVTNVYNAYNNYGSGPSSRMDIKADFVLEYNDPRRAFDSSDINGAGYLRLPSGARVWSPPLRCYNSSGAYSGNWVVIQADYYYSKELLVSAGGRVFIRMPVQIQGIVATEGGQEGTYKFQISPNVHTLDEVKLSWRTKNPVEVVADAGGRTAGVTTGPCKRTEDDGSFGVRKFSCLELSIKMPSYSGMTPTSGWTTPNAIG